MAVLGRATYTPHILMSEGGTGSGTGEYDDTDVAEMK